MAESLIGKQYRPNITGKELNLSEKRYIVSNLGVSKEIYTIISESFAITEVNAIGIRDSMIKIVATNSGGNAFLLDFNPKNIVSKLEPYAGDASYKKSPRKPRDNDEKELEYSTPAFDKIEYDEEIIEDDEDDSYFDDEEDEGI